MGANSSKNFSDFATGFKKGFSDVLGMAGQAADVVTKFTPLGSVLGGLPKIGGLLSMASKFGGQG